MTFNQTTLTTPLLRASKTLADIITTNRLHVPAAAKARLSRTDLNAAMTLSFGGSDTDGAWTQRQSFEALEYAQTLLLKYGLLGADSDPHDTLAQLSALGQRLPTATVRSQDQIRLQQFSTPMALAFVAAAFAQISPNDVVLEPSAGTGLLAVHAFLKGARLVLNEFDPARAADLSALFDGAHVLQHDGASIDNLLDPQLLPSVVLMNPPFSIDAQGSDDRHTAARHCASALRRLRPGGRCVALMPGWFYDTGIHARSFSMLTDIALLRANILLPASAFAKHGTLADVRLMIFDKCADNYTGSSPVLIRQVDTLSDLLDLVSLLPRPDDQTFDHRPEVSAPTQQVPTLQTPAPRPLGFMSKGATGTGPLPTKRQLVRSTQAAPETTDGALAYTALDIPRAALPAVGLYQPYRVSRLDLPGAADHPTPLVESIAMASVAYPKPRYQPWLPARLVSEAVLSAPQLESVIYAGDAHSRFMANRFVCSQDGTRLDLHEKGMRYRTGFMLGDGTGCGKGRQGAAIILDNWLQGRRRALWISMSSALIEDARRDWAAVGGIGLDIQRQDNWKLAGTIGMTEGILFTTYACLRSAKDGRSRLDQLLSWLGTDFDGVILFDEAHAMANAAPVANDVRAVKASAQGIAGLTLQNKCPGARIVYISATGATRIENLAYAQRLDLWGPHTAFATREIFVTELTEGGIAALELIARDLKAQGLYAARALSYAGVEYDLLLHDLTPEQIAAYDAYCAAWAIIHRNLNKVLEATNVIDGHSGKTLNAFAKGAALSQFESTKQRFFGQLLTGAKVPTLIDAIRADLREGRAVVVQLVSTAEAMLARRLASLDDTDRAELSIELSPREYVIDYLETAFPTTMMTIVTGDDETLHSIPAIDAAGNPVICQEAVHRRNGMIEQLCALPPVPVALDQIIHAFGKDNVAEVTGRNRRLITWSNGRQSVERRPASANLAEAQSFMDGKKNILLFSDAGGTGRSYHADLNARNQKRRVHYLLEPGWRADRAIQGLGRTHRTHQASAPLFRPVTTNCKGERRFISTIARRLDSLGAITRGQRQTGGQNMFNPADNLESAIARESLVRWFKLLHGGKVACISLAEFETRTGLELTHAGALCPTLPPIHRFLNRLLALPIQLQNDIFDSFSSVIAARTEAAIEAGTLDRGVEELAAIRIDILADHLLRTDPVTQAETRLLELTIEQKRWTQSLESVLAQHPDDAPQPMVNSQSKRVCLVRHAYSFMDDHGQLIERLQLVRPTGSERITAEELAKSHWEQADITRVRSLWSQELEQAALDPLRQTLRMVTGSILPVWHLLKGAHPTVYRLTTPGQLPILGRVVQAKDLPKLAAALGVGDQVPLTPTQILAAVMEEGDVFSFDGPDRLVLKRARVNGNKRFELTGIHAARLPYYKALGCFTEIIAYNTRLFAPQGRAEAIIADILQGHTLVVELENAA